MTGYSWTAHDKVRQPAGVGAAVGREWEGCGASGAEGTRGWCGALVEERGRVAGTMVGGRAAAVGARLVLVRSSSSGGGVGTMAVVAAVSS
jgi:hypothetical protein